MNFSDDSSTKYEVVLINTVSRQLAQLKCILLAMPVTDASPL